MLHEQEYLIHYFKLEWKYIRAVKREGKYYHYQNEKLLSNEYIYWVEKLEN